MIEIAIVDYGMGNLHSAAKAFESFGVTTYVTQDAACVADATHVLLPGVGAFPEAMARLKETGMDAAVRAAAAAGKPLLGICLGMQLLFAYSTEGERTEGLGLVSGGITLMDAAGEKIPHMGWNEVEDKKNCPLLQDVSGRNFYFVHSFCAADTKNPAAAGITTYGRPFVSVVWDGKNVFGTQFHPEKSGDAGLRLLKNFLAFQGGD